MKNSLLLFWLAASLAASAQATQKPATTTTPHAASAHPAAVKLPPGVPQVIGPVSTAFALKYQEIKIGTGPEALPFKVYKVFYTGYRAADGVVFDRPADHRNPIMGPDGKPEQDPDGKPRLGDPEPLAFAQGAGKLIPGFDQGFIGMRVGGKRRLFIPWQLAYGTRSFPDQPAQNGQPAHPGIPAKSDLIFDVELVDVSELPAGHAPMGSAATPKTATPAGSSAPATAPQSSDPAQPSQDTPPPPQE